MNCPNCGTANLDNATICANCGRPLTQQQAAYTPPPPPPAAGYGAAAAAPGPVIPNYLVQSILVTICCCIPFGVVAIIFAAQVNSKLAQGDVAGAQAASKNAKMWCWIAFGTGLVIIALSMVFNGMAILQGIRDGSLHQ